MKALMLKRRPFWFAMAALLLLAAVLASMQFRQSAKVAAPRAATTAAPVLEFLPSDIAEAALHDLRQTLTLTGALRPVNQAAIKARVAGDVKEVLVREGESVKAGQVLVKMDIREYEGRVAQARGALLAAQGQLDIASKARDNNRALLEKNFISRNAFDNAQSQFEIARANVASARAALDVVQKSLSDTVIRTPITGVVSSRTVQPGEKISADNRLLDVIDLSMMELEGAVPTSDIMNVALGQEVRVRFAGLSDPVSGTVVRINPATQAGSRSVLVYVRLENPEHRLKAGMFGEASLTLAKKQGVLTIPQSAVRTDAGRTYVYAIEQGAVTEKPVSLGLRGNVEGEPSVEVIGGLAAGSRVVRTDVGELHPGTLVRVTGAADATAGNGAGNGASVR